MMDTKVGIEGLLQKMRFKKVIPYLSGDVMDFGGNEGELKPYVYGNYLVVNYDHSVMDNKHFDTIVSLAVIEHIEYNEVFNIFKRFKKVLNEDGFIIITTPSRLSKPILEILASLKLLDSKNIQEHKHYWTKRELFDLANKSKLIIKKYKTFQFGMNQFIVMQQCHTK